MANNSGLVVDALLKTDPELAKNIDAENSWKEELTKQGARVRLFRRYERGDHRANLTPQMRDMLRLKIGEDRLNEFNINYMKIVVDKMASRISVGNIKVADQANDWLGETLKRNRFDASQSMWFRGAIRDGDAYVMIDPVTMAWTSEPAYDGFSGVVALFSNNEMIWAAKLWSMADIEDVSGNETDEATMTVMVYQPNKISRWQGKIDGSEVKPVTAENADNKKTWALGKIPLVHFANQKDNFTSHGESELRVAILPQDALNRTLHSMIMASEFSAFNILWSIGMEISVKDIQPGAVINLVLKDKNDKVLTKLDDKLLAFLDKVQVGQFKGTDIGQYVNQMDHLVRQISQVTQTPIYGVTATGNLSGEALKQLEIGLLGKIKRFQDQNIDAIQNLIEMTADTQNKFDNDLGNAPELGKVDVIWDNAEILDVNARISTLTSLREKAPNLFTDEFFIKRIGSLLGMSQSDIDAEIENAANNQTDLFTRLTAGAGNVPVA